LIVRVKESNLNVGRVPLTNRAEPCVIPFGNQKDIEKVRLEGDIADVLGVASAT